MRFGIIGRNFIVDEFISSGKLIKDFSVTAIYTRNEKDAVEFSEKYGIKKIYTDLKKMVKSGEIDALYIASPNSLHPSQCATALLAKIPVLCEKPFATDRYYVQALRELALFTNTYVLEAMRPRYNPKLEKIRGALEKIGTIQGGELKFCKYSSRYDSYKKGEILNAFKVELGNGSLLDLGIYPLSVALELFGNPKFSKATGSLMETGVDSGGVILLEYEKFPITVTHSKVSTSFTPSEIRGELGSILINEISTLKGVKIVYKDGREELIDENEIGLDMYYEIQYFINNCKTSEKNSLNSTYSVISILDRVRKIVGVKYPKD